MDDARNWNPDKKAARTISKGDIQDRAYSEINIIRLISKQRKTIIITGFRWWRLPIQQPDTGKFIKWQQEPPQSLSHSTTRGGPKNVKHVASIINHHLISIAKNVPLLNTEYLPAYLPALDSSLILQEWMSIITWGESIGVRPAILMAFQYKSFENLLPT